MKSHIVVVVVFRRKKRDTSSSEADTEGDMLPVDAIDPPEPVDVPGEEGEDVNDSWPTPSGITLDIANSSCVTPIYSLPIFETCDEYTKETRKDIIESCILDIQVGSISRSINIRLLKLFTECSQKQRKYTKLK